jgi:NAD(P)-dependent dehydrogenase (short-subunit alcohol dehydrogenase family)
MDGDRGYVVVTGTSTGIGAATGVHLAETGFHVFAGVRREADGEALQAQTQEKLTPLIIDVTDESTISSAAAAVADAVGDRGLAGLVNNAGIGVPAPIERRPAGTRSARASSRPRRSPRSRSKWQPWPPPSTRSRPSKRRARRSEILD